MTDRWMDGRYCSAIVVGKDGETGHPPCRILFQPSYPSVSRSDRRVTRQPVASYPCTSTYRALCAQVTDNTAPALAKNNNSRNNDAGDDGATLLRPGSALGAVDRYTGR